jgi:hypothetical protein
VKWRTLAGVNRGPRPLGARYASWPTIAVIALALTAGTGTGHQMLANASDWISALTAATSHRAAAIAVVTINRIDAAHADSQAADPRYLFEHDRVGGIERINDSDKPLIALVVAALLVVLAVLERLDAVLAHDSLEANSDAAARIVEASLFHPPAIEPATAPRARIECLGAQNESEIIARHADRPVTRSVAAVLRHSIN